MTVIAMKSLPTVVAVPLRAAGVALLALRGAIVMVGAAARVADAVENHRKPSSADLAELNIEGVEFPRHT